MWVPPRFASVYLLYVFPGVFDMDDMDVFRCRAVSLNAPHEFHIS